MQLGAERPDVGVTKVIDKDQDEIRLVRGSGDRRTAEREGEKELGHRDSQHRCASVRMTNGSLARLHCGADAAATQANIPQGAGHCGAAARMRRSRTLFAVGPVMIRSSSSRKKP